MLVIVQRLAWLVCVIYSTIPSFWLLIHSRADHWRARPRSPYEILVPVWVAMWLVVAVSTSPWSTAVLYASNWGWLPALCLFLLGLWLYLRAGATFGLKQLTGVPELRAKQADQMLITSGIRARVRHPVYLAHLSEMLAWSVGSGLMVCFGLTLFAIVTGAAMIRAEDAELERRFGERYRSYRESVPAIVPRIRRETVGL